MRMLSAAALCLLAATSASASNQDPPLSREEAAETLALINIDSRMTVPVQIGTTGPHRFVIDTGAQRTVISRELALTLGLLKGRDVRLTSMTGASRVGTAIIPSIKVSILGGERIEAPALAARHLGASGMLGIDALQGHKLSINFDTDTMSISPSKRRPRPTESFARGDIVIRAASVFGQLVVTDAKYRGRKVQVVLDTGSPVSIGNNALRLLVAKRGKIEPILLTSVTGQEMSANYTQIDAVEMGGAIFQNLPIAFADAAPFKQFKLEKRPAILLGMDALGLFRRVDIDFANRELRLARPRG
jgi:predicted aspartyl protease